MMYADPDDTIIPVIDRVAPWTCKVCGLLVLDYELHAHTAQEWRTAR